MSHATDRGTLPALTFSGDTPRYCRVVEVRDGLVTEDRRNG